MTLIDKKIINRNASLNKKKLHSMPEANQILFDALWFLVTKLSKNLQHGIKRILITYSQRVLK